MRFKINDVLDITNGKLVISNDIQEITDYLPIQEKFLLQKFFFLFQEKNLMDMILLLQLLKKVLGVFLLIKAIKTL